MRLEPSDLEIETVVARIQRKDLDLQPEFQRGEVWSKAKKQRLVDSVLRNWHIPPIHVIELKESRRQEVLDGQQRLAAIRDFVEGQFPVDGSIEPADTRIVALDGMKYRELPDEWKRQINQFTLRIIRIVDYSADEPGELFFRLNQPTSLTSAEQRNAFFGPVRAQIKTLVDLLKEDDVGKEILGFSNSRMAYDDVLARVAVTVERNDLAQKITSSDLVDRYRSEDPLQERAIHMIQHAIEVFHGAREELRDRVQLNKATVYSWFLFVIRADVIGTGTFNSKLLGGFLPWFEGQKLLSDLIRPGVTTRELLLHQLMRIYIDRSAARVADVSSVVLRDAAIWAHFQSFLKQAGPDMQSRFSPSVRFDVFQRVVSDAESPLVDDAFARALMHSGWRALL